MSFAILRCQKEAEGDNSCAERSAEENKSCAERGLPRQVFYNIFVVIVMCQRQCWYRRRLRGTTLVQKGGLRRNKTYAEEGSPGMCFTVFLLVYLCVKGRSGAEGG